MQPERIVRRGPQPRCAVRLFQHVRVGAVIFFVLARSRACCGEMERMRPQACPQPVPAGTWSRYGKFFLFFLPGSRSGGDLIGLTSTFPQWWTCLSLALFSPGIATIVNGIFISKVAGCGIFVTRVLCQGFGNGREDKSRIT
jgi:hypothetical protein